MLFNLNLANSITFSRIFGVAYIFWLAPFEQETAQLLAILVFTVVAVTDALDGWVARKYKIVTEFGKMLDPLADKILLLVLLPLLSMKAIGPFPVFLIFAREFSVMGIRVLAAKRKFNIAASWLGKLKTAITFPICGLLFARPVVLELESIPTGLGFIVMLKRWIFSWPPALFDGLIWSIVAITWISFFHYFFTFMWKMQVLKCRNDEKKAKKAFLTYIPNTVTLLNLGCGVASIVTSILGNLEWSGVLILLGMIFDGLDGKIARKLNVFSAFGEKIDTRADYITFGIAPSFLLASYFLQHSNYFIVSLGCLLAAGFFWAVKTRLKRFEELGHQPFFEGIPSPVGAMFVAVSMFSILSLHVWVLILTNIINASLMVSTLRYPHNDAANQKMFYKYLKLPTLILIVLIIVQQAASIHIDFPLHNLLLGLMVMYYMAPLIAEKKS